MSDFIEFPNTTRFTRIPEEFFTQILADINNQYAFKVILFTFWRLEMSEDEIFYLTKEGFLDDTHLMRGFGETKEQQRSNLDDGLKVATEMNILLPTAAISENKDEIFYFLNTPKGRAAAQGLENGDWNPKVRTINPIELIQQPSNAFRLYEENIGPLTPMIADMIRADEVEYPAVWIEDAIETAVKNNKRSWSYIQAILKRWQANGR